VGGFARSFFPTIYALAVLYVTVTGDVILTNKREERFLVYSSDGQLLHHVEMRPASMSGCLSRYAVRAITDGYLVVTTALDEAGDGSCKTQLELKTLKLDSTSGEWTVKPPLVDVIFNQTEIDSCYKC